jgi:PAS domain S-box-containing protein
MEGWGWQSVHDPNELPKVIERWKVSIATGEPFDMVFPLRGADGVFRPFLTRIVPLRDTQGRVVRWFGTNTDISEQRRIEQALRQSEERWATTLRSIGDAVISTCARGKVIFMNDVAQTLTGWTLADAQGKDLETVFNIVNEVTRIKPENPVSRVIRHGQIVGLANHTALISRDGTEYPIEDSAAPIRNKDGEITGVVLVFHNVIEKRKSEKALQNSERLATTGRLAATLAHEIHNPLDTVGNLLYLMEQAPKLEDARQYVALASQEVARVTQMTRHMLAFQRESNKPVPVNIAEIFDSVVVLFERKIQSAGIQVEKHVQFEQEFLGLPGEMRQVFANLFGNAVEAVGKNGKIRLSAYASHNWRTGEFGLRVVVADNGPGIPANIRGKIFDPFFTTKGEAGTGLGLWITSGIVHNSGGTLSLRSVTRDGRTGTCFSVFLPIK